MVGDRVWLGDVQDNTGISPGDKVGVGCEAWIQLGTDCMSRV